MTRVLLTEWEWACCGDPFAVGDVVDFGIRTRTLHSSLVESFGPALAATVDAVESHHEEEFPDRVRGRVTAVYAVRHEVIERPTLRRPGHGAPEDATMPAEGEEWPMVRYELGNGVFAGTRPSRYVIEVVPVPGSATLAPVPGVRLPAPEGDALDAAAVERAADTPEERRVRALEGWMVDVEESEAP